MPFSRVPWHGARTGRRVRLMRMTRRHPTITMLAVVFLFATSAPPTPAAKAPPPRDVPGQTADGRVRLPNGWFLSPAGKQVKVGDFPLGLAISPDGRTAAVTHS